MEPAISSLEIRDAHPVDAPALAALLGELGFPAPASTIASRLGILLNATEVVLVAERDGVLLGLVTVHVTPMLHRPTPVGRFTVLVVAERARRRVETTSNQRLTETHSFDERLGYEATGLRFKKALSPSVG